MNNNNTNTTAARFAFWANATPRGLWLESMEEGKPLFFPWEVVEVYWDLYPGGHAALDDTLEALLALKNERDLVNSGSLGRGPAEVAWVSGSSSHTMGEGNSPWAALRDALAGAIGHERLRIERWLSAPARMGSAPLSERYGDAQLVLRTSK